MSRESLSLICMAQRILIFVIFPIVAYKAEGQMVFVGTIAFVLIACLYHLITYMRRANQPKQGP